MSVAQIVIRTIVTTVDLLLTIAVIKADSTTNGMIKAFVIVILLNLMGVWI